MKSLFEKLKKVSLEESKLLKIKGGDNRPTITRTKGSSGLSNMPDPVYNDGSDTK
jgi:hypothetical protein